MEKLILQSFLLSIEVAQLRNIFLGGINILGSGGAKMIQSIHFYRMGPPSYKLAYKPL